MDNSVLKCRRLGNPSQRTPYFIGLLLRQQVLLYVINLVVDKITIFYFIKFVLHCPISFRPRPIKFHDYLPTNQSLYTGMKRSSPAIDPMISYSDAAKSFDAKYYDSMIYGGEERSDDRLVFKIPQTPQPPPPRNTFRGSVESIPSSGYQSDGYNPIDGSYPVGMSNIRQWLKSLRLHKYTYVFNNISYEKMFTMTEEYLKSLNITQGASRKLANCIEKLQTRCELMKQAELSLTQNPNRLVVAEAIKDMESIVSSPMKPMRYQCDTDPGYRLWQVLFLGK